ncbi:MAG: hypothetical protein JRG74_14235, partial [Deltaproteobacteria bacterium]|nr:hypothetical protein [Deltaproteobacteria bacterium]
LRAISVGIIITRCDELRDIFNDIKRGNSYGASTTHMSKLLLIAFLSWLKFADYFKQAEKTQFILNTKRKSIYYNLFIGVF